VITGGSRGLGLSYPLRADHRSEFEEELVYTDRLWLAVLPVCISLAWSSLENGAIDGF
jgi:hypothetical protein